MKALFERWVLLFILLTTSGQVLAEPGNEEFDPLKDFLSIKYEAGPALVYDCLDKHWVCTGKSEHKDCTGRRLKNIEEGRIELNCMADKVFESKYDCVNFLERIIHRGNVPRGCLHPEHRKRFIGFR